MMKQLKKLMISVKNNFKSKTYYNSKTLSNESKLLNITFSQGKLTPEFKSDVKEYKVFDIRDTIKTITINPTWITAHLQLNVNLVVIMIIIKEDLI